MGTLERKTPLKRKRAKPRRRPGARCSWSTRCTREARNRISDDERYCGTHLRLTAEHLVGLFVKERDHWTCQRCSASSLTDSDVVIQWAHILTRGHAALKFDPENSMALCRNCHFHFTKNPTAWFRWLETNRPGLEDALRETERDRSAAGIHVNLIEVVREFRDKVAA